MKKPTSLLIMSLIIGSITVSAMSGCSSAKKEEVETPVSVVSPATEAALPESSPVDLGASSAGRGL